MYSIKLLKLSIALLTALFMGCTSMGVATTPINNYYFGNQQEIVFCTYKTKEITNERVKFLMDEIADEYSKFNIKVKHAWNKNIETEFASSSQLFQSLATEELKAPCDRRLFFLNYTFYDNLTGLLGVELLGAVETETMTNGYIFAQHGISLNRLMLTPQKVVRHESLHLLGCEHGIDKSDCFEQIINVKKRKNSDFFPSYSATTNKYFLTRVNVNNHLRKYRKISRIGLLVTGENVNNHLRKHRKISRIGLLVTGENVNNHLRKHRKISRIGLLVSKVANKSSHND